VTVAFRHAEYKRQSINVPQLQSAYQIYCSTKAIVLNVFLGGPDVTSRFQQLALLTFLDLSMAHLSPQTDV